MLFSNLSRHAIRMRPIKTVGLKRSWNINSRRFLGNNPAAKKSTGLKALMQTYGYSALAVYLGLSMIDLPICFFMVHSLGEETIKVYINKAKQLVGYGKDEQQLIKEIRQKIAVEEQDKLSNAGRREVSLWQRFKESTLLTEFLIAYGIHKSLIVIRLPITAAITPATIKIFQKWGFNLNRFNRSFKTMGDSAKLRNKSGDPNDFIKANQIPKQKPTKGQKWFDGLMWAAMDGRNERLFYTYTHVCWPPLHKGEDVDLLVNTSKRILVLSVHRDGINMCVYKRKRDSGSERMEKVN